MLYGNVAECCRSTLVRKIQNTFFPSADKYALACMLQC